MSRGMYGRCSRRGPVSSVLGVECCASSLRRFANFLSAFLCVTHLWHKFASKLLLLVKFTRSVRYNIFLASETILLILCYSLTLGFISGSTVKFYSTEGSYFVLKWVCYAGKISALCRKEKNQGHRHWCNPFGHGVRKNLSLTFLVILLGSYCIFSFHRYHINEVSSSCESYAQEMSSNRWDSAFSLHSNYICLALQGVYPREIYGDIQK